MQRGYKIPQKSSARKPLITVALLRLSVLMAKIISLLFGEAVRIHIFSWLTREREILHECYMIENHGEMLFTLL